MAINTVTAKPAEGMTFLQVNVKVEYMTCPTCNGRGSDFLMILRCEPCQGTGQVLIDLSEESHPF